MNKQSVDEFMEMVASIQADPEALLRAQDYKPNVERYPQYHYIMRVWVKDTDEGRYLVMVTDEQTWNVDVQYRKWAMEMLSYYRELGCAEAKVRTVLSDTCLD